MKITQVLLVMILLTAAFEAGCQESILTKKYDFSKERSLEQQYYEMDVEIITRAGDGSRANVESYSMHIMGEPATLPSGISGRWTCSNFSIKLGENPEVTIPAMEGWHYDFNRSVAIDEHGQVMGIPHEKFENLVDHHGNKLEAIVAYQVYNQFVQFHAYVDLFAVADPEGGKGIQDLQFIGDMTILDDYSEDLPLNVGLIIQEGSIYRPGLETIDFKGLSYLEGKSCALLGIDGGEGAYTMIMEVMPNLNATTVGSTRIFGDLYVDIETMWLIKAEITVIDVTETSIGGNVVANTTIESHFSIRSLTK